MRCTFPWTRRVLGVYLVFLACTSLVVWIISTPSTSEKYATISLLSGKMTGTGYFPGNTSLVSIGDLITWNVQVYNHMGTAQLILLRVKLSNETIPGPDPTTNSPSLGSTIFQFSRAVFNNETLTEPLRWSVQNVTGVSPILIRTVLVNNQTASGIDISSSSGMQFRIVIELWTYDLQEHDFLFSFVSEGVLRSVWNQVWFDI